MLSNLTRSNNSQPHSNACKLLANNNTRKLSSRLNNSKVSADSNKLNSSSKIERKCRMEGPSSSKCKACRIEADLVKGRILLRLTSWSIQSAFYISDM
jgi:hypothetical protein